MESGHKGGDGAAGGGGGGGGEGAGGGAGHLCHLCGYQYQSTHPSAKQRRAHRKNCGKMPSAAAAAVEVESAGDGEKSLLGDECAGGGGEGNAAEFGGGLPGSAEQEMDVVHGDGNAEDYTPDGTGVEVVVTKCTDDVDGIPSEKDFKANGTDDHDTETELVVQLSEHAPHLEDGPPSQPAVSSDGARLISEFSVEEINKSLASNATANKISAQSNATLDCLNDASVTEVDDTVNPIGEDETSEKLLVIGSEDNFSFQQMPQTKIAVGHTAANEDSSINNYNVVSMEAIPSEDTVFMEQVSNNTVEPVNLNSVEQVSNCTIKEPANSLGDKESCIEKHVFTYHNNDDNLSELASSNCHLEAPDIIKPQQQTDCTSVATDQLIISKLMDIDEGKHCSDTGGEVQGLSSVVAHAVGSEVISDGSAVNLTKDVFSPHVTGENAIHDNASQTSDITLMPSQVDIMEVRKSPTSHEIDLASSKDGIEEDIQDVNVSPNLISHEINEGHILDVEEKKQNEDITAYTTSQQSNAVCCTIGENMQNEEIMAETTSHKAEETEQTVEVNGYPVCDEVNLTSSRDTVEHTKQREISVKTTHEENMVCSLENVEEKKQVNEITADPSCMINGVNLPSDLELSNNEETTTDHIAYETNTKNVEEKKQNKEIMIDPSTSCINMICSTSNDEHKLSEEMPDGPNIVQHDKLNVEENKSGETMSDPTSYSINVVSTSDSVEEINQNGQATTGPTFPDNSVICINATDNVEEKKNEVTPSELTSCKISAESNAENIEEKRQNGEITDSSHESNTLQTTDGAENTKQIEEASTDSASEKINVVQSTDDAEEIKRKGDTVSTDDPKGNDQNEVIADKEVIVNLDRNHVSLKNLLADNGTESKEKKASTKDRVLSFRRRVSKDNASSVKASSPKAESGQQDWNSPARLPAEKRSKGKKQQWVPFMCCSATPSIN